ncbi:acetoacetate decarboxylase family protein [Actinophytocola oryzae]|uniref:Acetoacetate decarboxylase n=1 Tax=Actinophytocola oryzae TaxID=502181 RepID=A0A4R7W3X3_9PSEU|nr:acetoacetate decarboxylase family protein [Actinophytocola oryzae]TDV57373.1 acetoacetate decarboxylase [Actinophytocola oryzae]
MTAPEQSATEAGYPPEPWDLRGHGYVSLWLVPTRELPPLPAGLRPVSTFGRTVVATAFVDYLPGGLLAYHELLVAPLVREGARPGLSITDIWVDSAASMAGGRELWGIPKDMAEFEMAHEPSFDATARLGKTVVASAHGTRGRRGLRLPFPLLGRASQALRGRLAHTPLRAGGRVHTARATWEVDGPLAWLRPYEPFLTVAATDFTLRFGPRRR